MRHPRTGRDDGKITGHLQANYRQPLISGFYRKAHGIVFCECIAGIANTIVIMQRAFPSSSKSVSS